MRGNIDFIKDGFIHGWAVTNHNIADTNNCDLYLDGQFISTFDCVLFREDLKAECIRSGIAGFSKPIPFVFCDEQSHHVSLQVSDSDIVIHTKTVTIAKNRNLVVLDENIIFDHVNNSYENQEKVLFLAGFTNQRTLLNYQKHLAKAFQDAGFYVIYVLASDVPNTLTGAFGAADRVIVRENMGYDFGSWATVFQLCQVEFLGAKEVIWANDSIVGPIGSLNTLLDKINASSADMWAITDSQDRKYHFQSYLWGIKKKTTQFIPALDAFFFYRQPLPNNRDDAIKNFELEAFSFFKSYGLKIEILFPEYALVGIAEEKLIANLQIYYTKWQYLFKLQSNQEKEQANYDLLQFANTIIKMQSTEDKEKSNTGLIKLANTVINRLPVNSSHVYWNSLLESGFPFIKRELLILNPTNYPFPQEFRIAFEFYKSSYLLEDLAENIALSQII